jgi:hypothetical protein
MDMPGTSSYSWVDISRKFLGTGSTELWSLMWLSSGRLGLVYIVLTDRDSGEQELFEAAELNTHSQRRLKYMDENL